MIRRLAVLLLFFSLAAHAHAQDLKLIPYPKQVERRDGRFVVTPGTRILVKHAEDRGAAQMLAEEIESATGRKPRIVSHGEGVGGILLTREPTQHAKIGLTGGPGAAAKSSDHPLYKEEGYTLECGGKRVVVRGATVAGVFYGVQTLRQLLVPEGKRMVCPAVAIRDWPSMRWRGLHDDVSRGPIPTLDFLKRQVRTLAEYKLNMLSLYMEAVFDYREHPLIAPKEAAITPGEITELVRYASRYHVMIVPEQEAFGHLHHVLKNEAYNALAETPHGHVLAPEQAGSHALIKSMFDELAQVFPAPFVHIGADETFELGRGQTKTRAEQVGIGRVYLEFLERITELIKPTGKRIIFWGDIAMRYPDLLGILPKNVIADAWAYDPRDSFDSMLKPYKDAGLELFVSPGVNNWGVIFPNLDRAYPNIARLVRDGQKFGALGMLNTNWNDSGEELIGATWAPTVLGAACAWQQGECSIAQFQAAYDWAFYRNPDNTFSEAINNLNRANALMKGAGLGEANDEYMWIDPFTPDGARFTEKALPIARELRLAAEHALAAIYRKRSQARLHADTLEPLILAALRLDLLGMKIQFADEISRYYRDAYENMGDQRRGWRDLSEISGMNARLPDLRDATTRARSLFAEQYLKENHPYWLGNVTVRYDNLASLFQAKLTAMQAVDRQYGETRTLPPPETLGFYKIATAPVAAPTPK